MSAQRTLFPHLEGGEGNRRAAVSRRAKRMREHARALVEDLYWLAERRPDLAERAADAIDLIEEARGEHLAPLFRAILSTQITTTTTQIP